VTNYISGVISVWVRCSADWNTSDTS